MFACGLTPSIPQQLPNGFKLVFGSFVNFEMGILVSLSVHGQIESLMENGIENLHLILIFCKEFFFSSQDGCILLRMLF
jgi:hypothetical protein